MARIDLLEEVIILDDFLIDESDSNDEKLEENIKKEFQNDSDEESISETLAVAYKDQIHLVTCCPQPFSTKSINSLKKAYREKDGSQPHFTNDGKPMKCNNKCVRFITQPLTIFLSPHGMILQEIPNPTFHGLIHDHPYSFYTINAYEKKLHCINMTPFIYEDLLVPVEDFFNEFFTSISLRVAKYILQDRLNCELYKPNRQQMKVFEYNGKCNSDTEIIPLVLVENVFNNLPQIQCLIDDQTSFL